MVEANIEPAHWLDEAIGRLTDQTRRSNRDLPLDEAVYLSVVDMLIASRVLRLCRGQSPSQKVEWQHHVLEYDLLRMVQGASAQLLGPYRLLFDSDDRCVVDVSEFLASPGGEFIDLCRAEIAACLGLGTNEDQVARRRTG